MVTIARHSHLLPDWTQVCSLLGLDQRDLDEISSRCRDLGTNERLYETLVVWSQKGDAGGGGGRHDRNVYDLEEILRQGGHQEIAGLARDSTK